ncbi:DUF5793 family protein [Halobacteriaceae archaeon GCM10025711]
MRREDFTLEVRDIDWVEDGDEPRRPTVTIDFQGPADELQKRLMGPAGEVLDAEETDVAYRLHAESVDGDASGVVGVTNRITGDFILELNVDADDVLTFIRAARRYGKHADGDGQYRVCIRIDGDEFVTYDKETFLVYNHAGELLRGDSLIPSGVEL